MEQYVKSFDGTKICYIYKPGKKNETLVFLHGVGGNWTVWKKEIDYFQKKGYPTLAIDLRGHGQSDAPEEFKKYRLPYFSKDIHSVLTKEKIKKFSLVGHSLGGCIAITYCTLYKKLVPTNLILVETATIYPFDHQHMLNYGPYLTNFLRFISNHKATHKQHFFHFKEVDLSVKGLKGHLNLISHLLHITPLRSIVKALDNAEKYAFKSQHQINQTLRNLKSPTLIIAGKYDRVIPQKYSEHIKSKVKSAKLNVLDGGHEIIVNQATQVSQEIHQFLKKPIS